LDGYVLNKVSNKLQQGNLGQSWPLHSGIKHVGPGPAVLMKWAAAVNSQPPSFHPSTWNLTLEL
jgi:hypothetical protein